MYRRSCTLKARQTVVISGLLCWGHKTAVSRLVLIIYGVPQSSNIASCKPPCTSLSLYVISLGLSAHLLANKGVSDAVSFFFAGVIVFLLLFFCPRPVSAWSIQCVWNQTRSRSLSRSIPRHRCIFLHNLHVSSFRFCRIRSACLPT